MPIEIEEAARVDGYKRWEILLRVVLPLVLPGAADDRHVRVHGVLEQPDLPAEPDHHAREADACPRRIQLSFTGQFKTDWGGMMAAATLTTLPLMAAFFAVQRSMIRGLTGGAVAGA